MPWTVLLPSGKYQGVYRDAENKVRSAGTFTQNAQALRAAGSKEVQQRGSNALDIDGGKITWGAWFELWHESRILAHATDMTYRSTAACHILPTWERKPLCDIKQLAVQTWTKRMLTEGRSPYVVRNALMLLKTSLNAAMYSGRIQVNPAHRVPYPPLPEGTERYLTPDEVERIAFFMSGRNATVVWTAVQTGLRFGELAGLHLSRVDFDRGVIRVVEQFDQKAYVIKPAPKDKEERTVPLPPDLLTMLAAHRDSYPAERPKTCGIRHLSGHCPGDLVFRGARGGPLKSNDWGKTVWKTALGLAGIEGRVRPHDMRHTYASWLLQQGVHLAVLAEMMGHSDWEVVKKYAHLSSTHHDAVRSALSTHRRTARRTATGGLVTLGDASSTEIEEAG